jgi:putative transposase
MAKSYDDASLGRLRQRILDKAMEAGRRIVLVDPRNTSQMCSSCQNMVHKELSDRMHVCPYCGLVMDRDLNASLNILRLGSTRDPIPT